MGIFGTKAVTLVGASEFRKKDLLDCLDFLSSKHAPSSIAVPPVSAVIVEITPRSEAPEKQELIDCWYQSSVLLFF